MLNANKNIDRLERDLRQAILAGTLAPSSRLVSVRSLADQYGLTYGRTLRALKRLEKQGILVTHHGGGTYVADQVAAQNSQQSRSNGSGDACALVVAPPHYWTGDELWFVEFIRGFESHLALKGAHIKVIAKDEYLKSAAAIPAEARTHVLLASLDDSQLALVRKRASDQTNFILAAFDPENADWALVVDIDGPAGMIAGVKALRERGHTEIAMLSWEMPKNLSALNWWPHRRENAYAIAMKDLRRKATVYRIPFPFIDVPTADQRRAIDEKLLQALTKRPRPTALLCVNDLLARLAMELCARKKIKVPAEMSIIGFDDDPWAITQGLTTFHRPYRELGQMCGDLILQNQHQARPSWRGALMIGPQLIQRSSMGMARV